MLSNEEFVEQTLTSNLFYLRTLKEFCINIQLSLPQVNMIYIRTAEAFAFRAEELIRATLQYANGNLSRLSIDSQIFVTDYTLDAELLTEKWFDVIVDTNITRDELVLSPGNVDDITVQMLDDLMEINKEAQVLTINFISFCQNIMDQIKGNHIFSYSYLLFYEYMIGEADLYLRILKRLVEKLTVDPSYVINYEYWFHVSMKNSALFIRGLVDPNSTDVFNQAQNFVYEFEALIEEYTKAELNPETQKNLTNQSIDLIDRYRAFLETILKRVLSSELHFIVEPIFLDNMYTEANYFKYNLLLNQEETEA